MKIILYDLMGIKSGMNTYLDAFADLLEEHDIQIEIMSNFNRDNKQQSLPNIFVKSHFKKVFNLLVSYVKLIFAIIGLKKDEYIIVLLYGVVLDIPLFFLAKLSKKVVLDIHETMALDYKNKLFRKILHFFYRTCSNKLIVHSDKIRDILAGLARKSEIIEVPLFRYHSDFNYDVKNIGSDMIDTFKNEHGTYFLFFGNIRPSKGIFDLLKATELLKDNDIKIIIAGQDIFNKIEEYTKTHTINNNVIFILRLLNDDEMKFLFTKSQATLLPYESISQSAVLQSAVSFRIPLLTSQIAYFREIINDFPSFGKYTETTNPLVFKDSIASFAEEITKREFYNKTEINKYYQYDRFVEFVNVLKDRLPCY